MGSCNAGFQEIFSPVIKTHAPDLSAARKIGRSPTSRMSSSLSYDSLSGGVSIIFTERSSSDKKVSNEYSLLLNFLL